MTLKRLTGTCVLLALAGCAANSRDTEHSATAAVPETPVEVMLYAEASRPDQLGRIVVPVMLNDQGPFYFMLDTGSTHTVIAEKTLVQLGLEPDRSRLVTVRGVGAVKRVPTVLMQGLQAGTMQFSRVRMPVLNGLVLEDLDGILGMNTLGNHRVSADFINEQIRISDVTGMPPDKRYSVVSFKTGMLASGRLAPTPTELKRLSKPLITIDARVGDIRTRAVIDTGGTKTLGNPALLRALRRAAGGKLTTAPTVVADATDGRHPALMTPVPSLAFGPVAVQGLPVAFGDFSVFELWGLNDRPTLLIGMDALHLLDGLIIDYPRRELQIARVAGDRPAAPPASAVSLQH